MQQSSAIFQGNYNNFEIPPEHKNHSQSQKNISNQQSNNFMDDNPWTKIFNTVYSDQNPIY